MAINEKSQEPQSKMQLWEAILTSLLHNFSHDLASGKSTEEVCEPVVRLALTSFRFWLVDIWSVDPRRERLILLSRMAKEALSNHGRTVIEIASSFSGAAVEARRPRIFTDLKAAVGARRFQNSAVIDELNLTWMLSIPIQNIANPHQVLLVLDFFGRKSLPAEIREENDRDEFFRLIRKYSKVLAGDVESNLRERTFRMSMRASHELSKLDRVTPEAASQAFADCVRRALDCDTVTVYLEDWTHKRLARRAESYSDARPATPRKLAFTTPGLVTDVWKTNREYLAPDLSQEDSSASLFAGSSGSQPASSLLVPLQDGLGKCRGVVQCTSYRGGLNAPWRRCLSYDDVAIVEAMGQAFAPPLERLLESERRDVSLQVLAHEFRVPIVALRAVTSRMKREYDASEFRFSFPHFDEVRTYLEIMQRLAKGVDQVRIGPDRIPVIPQDTRLFKDVVAPAKRFLQPLLTEHGFQYDQLTNLGFEQIPRVEVDKALLTQVVFNLIENAVKYYPHAYKPVKEFSCIIEGQWRQGTLTILVTDNGPGVSEQDAEQIFDFGFRGEEAEQASVRGTGLGLWLSREIAKRLGGGLALRSRRSPTIFELRIPAPRVLN